MNNNMFCDCLLISSNRNICTFCNKIIKNFCDCKLIHIIYYNNMKLCLFCGHLKKNYNKI